MAAHSSVLAWRIPGRGSLVGYRLWGRTGSDATEATQQQQEQVYYRCVEERVDKCTDNRNTVCNVRLWKQADLPS